MEINSKNAMRLWAMQFGDVDDALDYSGRKIKKCAYNDRNSLFGWNIDHILPKSQGGKNEENNLICCHIKTNDEKADNFPVFTANGKTFQIIKKGKLWVIEEVKKQNKTDNAMALNVWQLLFGKAGQAEDFAGRTVYKEHYKKIGSNFAWDIAPSIESKPLDYNNVFLANVTTIEEKAGKPAFKANDKVFTVKKRDGKYAIVRTDAIEDAFEPINLKHFFSSLNINSQVFANYILVKVGRNEHFYPQIDLFYSLLISLKEILRSFEIDFLIETVKQQNLIIIKTLTPKKDEVQKVFDAASVLNTYKEVLMEEFELEKFIVINALFKITKLEYEAEFTEAQKHNDGMKQILKALSIEDNYNKMKNSLYINTDIEVNINKKDRPNITDKWIEYGLTEHNLIFIELNKILNG